MTDFLVRRFVRDSENTESTEVRTRYGILASVVGIFCNVFLFAAKLIIGTLMHSLAVTADAFNNLSDAASSIISFIGVKMAGKPADAEHPFGHGRIEYIAALIVSFLVIEVGFTFFKTSAGKLMHPEDITFDLVPFLILILSILVKLWMAAFNRKLGKKIDSKVMLATAADSLGDVITTSATVVSILICYVANVNIDAIAGLIVSLLVIWSGFSIAKDTLEPLIGQRVPAELYQKISQMSRGGIPVLDARTRPCKVEKIGKYRFRIILTQGLNRQIRRMCEYCGCRVKKLVRVRVMNIELGNLPKGQYRDVTEAEMQELYRQLRAGNKKAGKSRRGTWRKNARE